MCEDDDDEVMCEDGESRPCMWTDHPHPLEGTPANQRDVSASASTSLPDLPTEFFWGLQKASGPVQQVKCLRGEHEAVEDKDGPLYMVKIRAAHPLDGIAYVCKHCRCLYVERA